ncbi:MAG: 3-isopropylmalate dehydratase small subunit [Proteobacteria bacterium]|nr:3-isopropylmalate dehydratase small subunit [Burkholderiales bacterium]
MKVLGRVRRFGDNIDTDAILPSRHMVTGDPQVLGRACFGDLLPDFAASVAPGDVLVAGENFGCGSSREHAPLALQGCGIACVVAASFSRIFFRSAVNLGLPVAECAPLAQRAREGDAIEIDLEAGTATLAGQAFPIAALPPQVLDILRAGGLVRVMTQRLQAGSGVPP